MKERDALQSELASVRANVIKNFAADLAVRRWKTKVDAVLALLEHTSESAVATARMALEHARHASLEYGKDASKGDAQTTESICTILKEAFLKAGNEFHKRGERSLDLLNGLDVDVAGLVTPVRQEWQGQWEETYELLDADLGRRGLLASGEVCVIFLSIGADAVLLASKGAVATEDARRLAEPQSDDGVLTSGINSAEGP